MSNRFAFATFCASARRKAAVAVYVALCTSGLGLSASDHNATIVIIDAPDAATGPGQGTITYGIDSEGAVVGFYADANGLSHGFVRTPQGAFIESDQATCSFGYPAVSINPAGAISGFCYDASSVWRGLVRAPDGTISTFDAPGAGTGVGQGTLATIISGINALGALSGEYIDTNNVHHGYLRAPDGTITPFDVPGQGTGSGQGVLLAFVCGSGPNPAGAIAGTYSDASNVYHGFLRARDGSFTTFDAPGAGTGTGQGTAPCGLDPTGAITGSLTDASNVGHGFLRTSAGSFTTFDVPGAGTTASQGTYPTTINPARTITGIYVDANNVVHGFSRDRKGSFTTFDAPGAVSTNPFGINPGGEITGFFIDNSGMFHGFVRIP